ncbi:RraA-like protein [Cadophora sp. DSE1049]|nr:RraA-like protein [Cadophora sp. DSE1049]
MSTSLSAATKALARFTTCDIGDALVTLGVVYGGHLSGLKMYSQNPNSPSSSTIPTNKVFGPAYTIEMVPQSDKTSPKPAKHFVDTIPKDAVVFVSQPKDMYSACWGGLMSMRAKYLGARGVAVDGRFRDVGEQRGLGFPVFARGTSILGSSIFSRTSRLNAPLLFTSTLQAEPLTINPGDLIMGDEDGVVVVPPGLVEQCLKLCEERWEIDEKTKEALERGEEMGPTIQRLRK